MTLAPAATFVRVERVRTLFCRMATDPFRRRACARRGPRCGCATAVGLKVTPPTDGSTSGSDAVLPPRCGAASSI